MPLNLDDYVKSSDADEDADVCPECGGMGELIYGDGGAGRDKPPTETGYTETCDVCEGTGLPPLVIEARKAVRERAE